MSRNRIENFILKQRLKLERVQADMSKITIENNIPCLVVSARRIENYNDERGRTEIEEQTLMVNFYKDIACTQKLNICIEDLATVTDTQAGTTKEYGLLTCDESASQTHHYECKLQRLNAP